MEHSEEKRFSESDIEIILEKRLKERDTAIWAKNINGALTHVTRSVDELSALLRQHINQPFHAGGAERVAELENKIDTTFETFAINDLTPEQRAAFPEVVREYVAHKKQVKERKTEEDRFWQKLGAVSMAVAVVVSVLAAMGFFAWIERHVFGA